MKFGMASWKIGLDTDLSVEKKLNITSKPFPIFPRIASDFDLPVSVCGT